MWHQIHPISRWSSSTEVQNSLRRKKEKPCSTVFHRLVLNKMLLPRLCWQFSQWTRQARPEQLLPSSSVSTAGLAVRSWCFPSLCHPGSKASPQELEAAQQAQAGGPDDPCVYTFPPNNPHRCAVLQGCSFHADSFVLSRMCAGISLAKTQFSWMTATQNNCSLQSKFGVKTLDFWRK